MEHEITPVDPQKGAHPVTHLHHVEPPTKDEGSERVLPRQVSSGSLRGTQTVGFGTDRLDGPNNKIVVSVPESYLSLTDITTGNVTSSLHGLAPKSPADATKFLNGAATPTYAQVKDSDMSLSDITTNNVSASLHGFIPKRSGTASNYFSGDGTYKDVTDALLSTSDITTNDVSTSKHGFTPKAPNSTAQFLDGTATWQALGWQLLGSVTGATLSLTSLTARQELMICCFAVASGGTLSVIMTFNNDSNTNYAITRSNAGGADTAAVSQAGLAVNASTAAQNTHFYGYTSNLSGSEKVGYVLSTESGAAGAATAPTRRETVTKWANTAAQITRVDVAKTAGTGSLGSTSYLIVFGRD